MQTPYDIYREFAEVHADRDCTTLHKNREHLQEMCFLPSGGAQNEEPGPCSYRPFAKQGKWTDIPIVLIPTQEAPGSRGPARLVAGPFLNTIQLAHLAYFR